MSDKENAAALLDSPVDLIRRVLLKHQTAVLSEFRAIIEAKNGELAALREQLQGGVVVPRESGSLELGDSPHLLAFMVELHSHLPEGKRPYGWADFSDEQRTRIKRAYDAMLAAAKEEGK